jgi:hypothetical protein
VDPAVASCTLTHVVIVLGSETGCAPFEVERVGGAG